MGRLASFLESLLDNLNNKLPNNGSSLAQNDFLVSLLFFLASLFPFVFIKVCILLLVFLYTTSTIPTLFARHIRSWNFTLGYSFSHCTSSKLFTQIE
eukprot:Gb_28388 [translate_table: standard]